MLRTGRLPELPAGEVHVWRFFLGDSGPADFGRPLHEEDARRAARFAFARDRGRFLRARHVLRNLLGSYLGVDPRSLAILYSPHGKPGVDAHFDLGFNMSHSGDHGLIAVARAAQVGVDIEEMSAREGLRALAASVFSEEEMQDLHEVSDSELAVPFLTCWTRKEACLKALGVGLTVEPKAVHVGIRPLRSQARIPEVGACESVEVASLPQDEHCVSALAVAGGYSRTRLLQWEP